MAADKETQKPTETHKGHSLPPYGEWQEGMNIQIGTCGYSDEELKTPAGKLDEPAADRDRVYCMFNHVGMFANADIRRSLG